MLVLYDLGNLGLFQPLPWQVCLGLHVGKLASINEDIDSQPLRKSHVRTCHIKESSTRMVFHIDDD